MFIKIIYTYAMSGNMHIHKSDRVEVSFTRLQVNDTKIICQKEISIRAEVITHSNNLLECTIAYNHKLEIQQNEYFAMIGHNIYQITSITKKEQKHLLMLKQICVESK